MAKPHTLKWLTREQLEPLWNARWISVQRIAEALGVTRQAVTYRAQKLGLPSRLGNYDPQKKVSDDLFREMWEAGVSSADIAKYCGYGRAGAVSTRRRNMGLRPRVRRKGGKKHAGWVETISLAQFLETKIAPLMAQEARNAA